MDWLSYHFVFPWYTVGNEYMRPAVAFLASLTPTGIVLLIRWVHEGFPYLGKYVAFWLGEGFCFAILNALVAIALDGQTPHAFYTQVWFYIAVALISYPIVARLTYREAKKARAKSRPEKVDNAVSEKTHGYFTLEVVIWATVCLSVLAIFQAPLWIWVIAVPTAAVWAYFFLVRDAKVPVPQSWQEWTGRHPVFLFALWLVLASVAVAPL